MTIDFETSSQTAVIPSQIEPAFSKSDGIPIEKIKVTLSPETVISRGYGEFILTRATKDRPIGKQLLPKGRSFMVSIELPPTCGLQRTLRDLSIAQTCSGFDLHSSRCAAGFHRSI